MQVQLVFPQISYFFKATIVFQANFETFTYTQDEMQPSDFSYLNFDPDRLVIFFAYIVYLNRENLMAKNYDFSRSFKFVFKAHNSFFMQEKVLGMHTKSLDYRSFQEEN
eukprot:TRINITY_DN4000_c0_g2_i1.p1 TRINITY_DN4000_c0_g2~~TRINITY_DN4000_c0_g2_i1.p1  ORF type:complete len:109 (-),score=12.22 TRINITY_DN4000_c0_g2_i1:249-575(-)